MKHSIQSPININNTLENYITCIDYTVSNKSFLLLKDVESDLLITTPQPKKENLAQYYVSDTYISHTDSSKSLSEAKKWFLKEKEMEEQTIKKDYLC